MNCPDFTILEEAIKHLLLLDGILGALVGLVLHCRVRDAKIYVGFLEKSDICGRAGAKVEIEMGGRFESNEIRQPVAYDDD